MAEDVSFRDLMRQVRAGDPQAAKELVRSYQWAIRFQVRVRLTDLDLRRLMDSMEGVQLVWARFFPRASASELELDDPKKLLNLLITLPPNKLPDQAKYPRGKRRSDGHKQGDIGVEKEPVDPHPGPEQVADERDFVQQLRTRLTANEQTL
jgi:hypothetical protein